MTVFEQGTLGGATYSDDGVFRYDLTRTWPTPLQETSKLRPDGSSYMVAWIGLNPSTATHDKNDATITVCTNYSRAWGADGMVMLNIFAFRARDPKVMKAAADPVGPSNDQIIMDWVNDPRVGLVMCVWGAHGKHLGRADKVLAMLRENDRGIPGCLVKNKDGSPHHPLYQSASLVPSPMWEG